MSFQQDRLERCREVSVNLRSELEAERRRVQKLLNVARGCFDYGGGYRADDAKLAIFHHGIQTVINALEGAMKEPASLQVRVLEGIGANAAAPDDRR